MVEDKQQLALVYFKTEDSYIARKRNEGFIRVDDCLSINVIGEYLGGKNAFTITTPKHEYVLVPESRFVSMRLSSGIACCLSKYQLLCTVHIHVCVDICN